MKTHVCLVSEQAAANLLPALDAELKPARVVLVVSEKMTKRAAQLSRVLKENGIAVEQKMLSDEHDFRKTQEELLELFSTMENDDVALNTTGGTKLMSVAAQSVAAECKWPMFYVDADTDRISWLGRDGSTTRERTLTEQLRLSHYLKSYGFEIRGRTAVQPDARQKTLVDTLLKDIGSLERPLSQLNWLAQQAEDGRKLSIRMTEGRLDSLSLDVLIRHFSDAGALSLQDGELRFRSEGDRDFVKGGWLELHVLQCLHQIKGPVGVRDFALNLEVRDDNGVTNELDAAFIARNRLFVIECKTARMDRPEAPKANDTLFKLAENCRRIGGLGTRGMLVSYRKLADPEKKLARALGIEVVSGEDVRRLPEKLKTWVRPA